MEYQAERAVDGSYISVGGAQPEGETEGFAGVGVRGKQALLVYALHWGNRLTLILVKGFGYNRAVGNFKLPGIWIKVRQGVLHPGAVVSLGEVLTIV